MRLRNIKFLEVLISLSPFLLAIIRYSSFVAHPSTKSGKGAGGVLISRPEFLAMMAGIGILFYIVCTLLSQKIAFWFVPKYEVLLRFVLIIGFALLGLNLVVSNFR